MTNCGYLPKREREIMDILYRLETATACEIHQALKNELSPSTVRTHLDRLFNRRLLRRVKVKRTFIYSPLVAKGCAARAALCNVINTYFHDSPREAEEYLAQVLSGFPRTCQSINQSGKEE